MKPSAAAARLSRYIRWMKWAVILLMVKVFFAILYQYRCYFPADFDSEFLMGRRDTFAGIYRLAFYVHILASPLAMIFGSVLMLSGRRVGFRKSHRTLGRIQVLLVLMAIVPSGLVMAGQAYTGPIAGSGFAMHALATAACMITAVYHARGGRVTLHRRWATRCFLLLCAPLLLRVMSGAILFAGIDSDWTYRLTAWLSWLIPLCVFEAWFQWSNQRLKTGFDLSHCAPQTRFN